MRMIPPAPDVQPEPPAAWRRRRAARRRAAAERWVGIGDLSAVELARVRRLRAGRESSAYVFDRIAAHRAWLNTQDAVSILDSLSHSLAAAPEAITGAITETAHTVAPSQSPLQSWSLRSSARGDGWSIKQPTGTRAPAQRSTV